MVEELVNRTIPTNGEYPFTPLEIVCLTNSESSVETLKLLLDSGADLNAPGSYPLLIASQVYKETIRESKEAAAISAEIISVLLDHGANPFRVVNGRFSVTAFQFMLRLGLPTQIYEKSLDMYRNGVREIHDNTYASE